MKPSSIEQGRLTMTKECLCKKAVHLLAILMIFSSLATAAARGDGEAPSNRLTLISRSSGLENPNKEEGRTELELADFNNDGHLDIVSVGDHGSPMVNSGEHGIMVWLGTGADVWSVRQSGSFGYGGCAAGALNSDGFMDLAWGIHHDWGSSGFGDRLMGAALGNGTGATWIPWGTGLASSGETWGMFSTALADFDCNGRLDVASLSFGGSNGLRLYENHGDGTWSQAYALTGGSVGYTIEACDVNADGFPDIVCTRSGTNVLLGDGAFGFTLAQSGLPSGTISGIHAGDMDNDGADDVVFALGSSGLRCYRFDSNAATWIPASNGLPASGSFELAQLGDLDGDGFLDIAAYNGPTGYTFLGDGGTSWAADATWTMPSPGDASALRVDGDADHDGREDIVVMADKSGFPFYRNQLRVYSPWLEPVDLSVQLTHPKGGETLRSGSVRTIRWLGAVPPAQGDASVTIRLSTNGAGGPWTTLATGLPNSGSYQWLVAGSGSGTCRIEVALTTGSAQAAAISPNDFTLVGGDLPLQADTDTIPSSGGTVNFFLDAGAANAGRSYYLVGGVSGTDPGTLLPGGQATIPINRDWFTDYVLAHLNTPLFTDFQSLLDGSGCGSAQLNAPPAPTWIGTTIHFAFALSGPWDFASNAVAVTVVP